MAVTKCLARGFIFEINTVSTTFVRIKGINQWGHSPADNDADTTDFDDAGAMSHLKASHGDEFTLTGFYLEDPDDGSRDPGQEAVEALSVEVGPDSLKGFRITSPGGVVKTFTASAKTTVGGGGTDDPASWECTLKVSGLVVVA